MILLHTLAVPQFEWNKKHVVRHVRVPAGGHLMRRTAVRLPPSGCAVVYHCPVRRCAVFAAHRPALVIGVPVGFVNVVESKERLLTACEACGVPAIVAMGRNSGSNVATAICNALVYSAVERLDPAARGRK